MSERTQNGKARSQDAAGATFCLVGGFFAVSIVLAMRGFEPKPGLIAALTTGVVGLIQLCGSWAALLLSACVAALGALLFLREEPLSAGRPLVALALGSAGLSLLLGAFGAGGTLGAVFPGLIEGFVGRALTAVLGLSIVWVGAMLLPLSRPKRESGAETVQRLGLSVRPDPAGVSPAEAALLVSESRTAPPRPAPRPEPVRESTLRPFTPPKPAAPPRPEAVSAAPAAVSRPQPPSVPPAAAPLTEAVAPPTPSWEAEPAAQVIESALEPEVDLAPSEADEDEEAPGAPADGVSPATLAAGLAHAFEAEDVELEDEPSAEAEELEDLEELGTEAAPARPPRAAWEQIGLFDEEELEEAPAKPAKVELTPAFDFESATPSPAAHEPELEESEDPFAVSAAPATGAVTELEAEAEEDEEEEAEEEEELAAPAATLAPAPAPPKKAPAASAPADFVIAPAAPPSKAEPAPSAEEESERWSRLVYEAGCAILEQKRVAVSMLERRFGVDFDQACRVLDELQQAGLIGPYMGGRTRDILLSREEWLAHAPHAS